MQFIVTFLLLSATGLINAGYLAYKHFQGKPLVCPINHDCNAVTNSRWGNIFGLRNEILGVLFYAGMFAGILIYVTKPELIPNLKLLLLIGGAVGLAFSAFFTLLQKFVIKDYCFYCLISAGLSLLLFINSLTLYLSAM